MSIRSWLTHSLPNWSDDCPVSGRIELEKMSHEADYMAGWNTFLDSLHTRPQPSELWPFDAPPSSDEHPRVSVRAAEEASPSVPFTPALEGPVMRSGPAAPPPRRRQVPGVELTELAANSFAFVRIAAEAGSSRGKAVSACTPGPWAFCRGLINFTLNWAKFPLGSTFTNASASPKNALKMIPATQAVDLPILTIVPCLETIPRDLPSGESCPHAANVDTFGPA